MLAKEALAKFKINGGCFLVGDEIGVAPAVPHNNGMYPGDMVKGMFYPFAGLLIVQHYLARPYMSGGIKLPEYGSAVPVAACAYAVFVGQGAGGVGTKTLDKIADKIILVVIAKAVVHIIGAYIIFSFV